MLTCLATIWTLTMISLSAAQPLEVSEPPDLSAIRAARTVPAFAQDEVPLIRIPRILRQAYTAPVCLEPHPTVGRAIRGPGTAVVDFRVSEGDPLDYSLDKVVELFGGLLEYRIIHNQIVIMPVKETEGKILSSLDVEVSLELENASVWEALKAIRRQINRQKRTSYPLSVYPRETEYFRRPVPELTEKRDITLSLSNVTAREAVCAIFSASSLDGWAYTYVTHTHADSLIIDWHASTRQIKMLETMSPEEIEWWRNETRRDQDEDDLSTAALPEKEREVTND